MVTAIASQRAASTAHPMNTMLSPPCWNIQPPRMPPSAAPRNWLVEYTPIAALPPAGETLLTSDGSEASSRLKAVKNTTVPTTSMARL